MDEFLTVGEIAELVKLNQQTVRHMIDRGELTAVRVGKRRVRVRRSDLDAFLEAWTAKIGRASKVRRAAGGGIGGRPGSLGGARHGAGRVNRGPRRR